MFINITSKIYNLFFILLLPFVFLRLLIKSLRSKAYRFRLQERLGIFIAPPKNTNNIWVHAVSVGEIIAAIPIIKKIQEKLPNVSIILTCTTPAGSDIIKKKLSDTVFHVYFPLDANFAIKNFLTKINPKLLIIIEKEIWPNIILNCHKNNIPIIVANAQVSNKSFYRYALIKPLIRSWLTKIMFICAQTKFDAYKFKKLTDPSSTKNVMVTGNSKFDLAWQNSCPNTPIASTKVSANSIDPGTQRPIWIAASTHHGEEDSILEAHRIILKNIPNALLILVPRHPERSSAIIKNLTSLNFTFKLRSNQQTLLDPNIQEQVYLIDSIGELNLLYTISQAAFVGGSLVPIGCHNVLEPASHAIPIATGPYTENCKQIAFRMKLANGLIVIKNSQELALIIMQWLMDENLRTTIGQNAKNYLYNQVGASEKIAHLVAEALC